MPMITSYRIKRYHQGHVDRMTTCMSAIVVIALMSLAVILVATISFAVIPGPANEEAPASRTIEVKSITYCSTNSTCAYIAKQSPCRRGVCVAGVCIEELQPEDTLCPLPSGKLGVCHWSGNCVVCNRNRQCPISTMPCEQPSCVAGGCIYTPAAFNTACIPSAPSLEVTGICNGVNVSCMDCYPGIKECTYVPTNPCIAPPTCTASNKCVSAKYGPEVNCGTGFCDRAGNCDPTVCASVDDCKLYNPTAPTCRHYICAGDHCQLELDAYLTKCGTNKRCDHYGDCSPALCMTGDAPTALPPSAECYSEWSCNGATHGWVRSSLVPHTPCDGGVCDGNGKCSQCFDVTECGGEDTIGCGINRCTEEKLCERINFEPMSSCGTDGHSRCDGQGTCISGLCASKTHCTYMPIGACDEEFCNDVTSRCDVRHLAEHTDCDGGSCDAAGVCAPCDDTTDCSYLAPGICEGTFCDPATSRCQVRAASAHTLCDGGFCDDTKSCVPCVDVSDCAPAPECNQATCTETGCHNIPITTTGATCEGGAKVCENGACVANQCESNGQCPDGMRCSLTGCTTSKGFHSDRCEVSSDCVWGLKCIGGVCRNCATDADCQNYLIPLCDQTTETCTSKLGAACNTQSDCGWSLACLNNVCSKCSSQAQCGYGKYCDIGKYCYVGPALVGGLCNTNANCSAGLLCSAHHNCTTAPAAYGERCETNDNCASGVCTAVGTCGSITLPTGCASTGCNPGYTCDPSGACVPIVSGGCLLDTDCTVSGQVCDAGICRFAITANECVVDADCGDMLSIRDGPINRIGDINVRYPNLLVSGMRSSHDSYIYTCTLTPNPTVGDIDSKCDWYETAFGVFNGTCHYRQPPAIVCRSGTTSYANPNAQSPSSLPATITVVSIDMDNSGRGLWFDDPVTRLPLLLINANATKVTLSIRYFSYQTLTYVSATLSGLGSIYISPFIRDGVTTLSCDGGSCSPHARCSWGSQCTTDVCRANLSC